MSTDKFRVLLGKPVFLYEKFHENSKLDKTKIRNFLLNNRAQKKPRFKAYARFPETFLDKSIGFKKNIGALLFQLGNTINQSERSLCEIYLLVFKGKMKGLYHYYLKHHSLEKLPLINNIDLNNYLIKKVSLCPEFILIFSAKLETLRYTGSERVYRNLLLEIGQLTEKSIHLGQQLKLDMEVVDFYDNEWNNLINIDGLRETVVKVMLSHYS